MIIGLSQEITCFIEKRKIYSKWEWALFVRFGDKDPWFITSWKKEPTKEMYEETLELVDRCFCVYHKHVIIPMYKSIKPVDFFE